MGVYNSKVLELTTQIENVDKDISDVNNNNNQVFILGDARKVSRICGSEIGLKVVYNKTQDKVEDFSIDPKACALGQASAAILSRNLVGANSNDIHSARDGLRKMLKEDGKPPEGRFWELRYLEEVADYPPRHASVMLAWEAACEILDKINNDRIKN